MTVERDEVMRQLSSAIPAKKGYDDRAYYLCEKAIDVYAAAERLAGLDAAEAAYAQNYDGANEGDAVAMAIEAIRTRIKSGHD